MFFEDFTDRMRAISEHLKTVDVEFDAIYTGFLGSVNQIETVMDIAESFKNDRNILLVDPVMGDDGKLYSTYNDELVAGIRRLSAHADVLTPNLTEACLLTGMKYPHSVKLTAKEADFCAKELISRLRDMYPKADIAVTGLISADRMLTVACKHNEAYELHEEKLCPISFPGTGDLFASLLLAEIVAEKDFVECVNRASALTTLAVEMSQNTDEPVRNGVLLEKFLAETDFC